MQINHITKQSYQGNNQTALQFVFKSNGYKSNEWLTFLQAKNKNLKIKKGSKGVKLLSVSDQEVAKIGSKNSITHAVRHFTVFNLDQMEETNGN